MTTNSPNPVDGETLTLLLKRITTEYLEWSENIETIEDANTCINSCKYIRFSESKKSISGEWFTCCREIKSDSTGICYAVACFVQEYMNISLGLDVEIFFIWRAFDPEYADEEDDTLHAGIYFDGKYYDTYNPDGVAVIEKLKFYQINSCNGKLFTRHEEDWIAFGRKAFNSNKEYKFMRYLKDKLNPVDGDVQALIERINVALKQFTSGRASMHVPPLDTDVDIVLADCEKMLKLLTPPAQLLRPVELPDIEENETAFKAGLNSLVDCLEDCGDAEQRLRLALRSISEKWHEVKS